MDKCDACGVCCKLFLINLTEEEYKSGKYKTQFQVFGQVDNFIEAEQDAANIIEQKEDGSCIYLENGKCSIHETRPQSCRKFFCSSKDEKYKTMIERVNRVKQATTLQS